MEGIGTRSKKKLTHMMKKNLKKNWYSEDILYLVGVVSQIHEKNL